MEEEVREWIEIAKQLKLDIEELACKNNMPEL